MSGVELADLDGQERVALLALLQRVLGGDGRVSDEERAEIGHLAEAFGQDGYRRAFDEAGRRFGDTDELKRFLAEVGRPEARELIMGELLEAAIQRVEARNPTVNAVIMPLYDHGRRAIADGLPDVVGRYVSAPAIALAKLSVSGSDATFRSTSLSGS